MNGDNPPQETDIMDIINPQDSEGNEVPEGGTVSETVTTDESPVKEKEIPEWVIWVSDNLVVSIVIAVLTVLILSCIIAILIRVAGARRTRRKHKIRPYKGDTFTSGNSSSKARNK